MAIYHFTAKVVSRGKGQSAVAKAAYNSRERLEDERTGEAHDYRRKGGIVFSGIFAPEDAPEWAHDRKTLHNEIEAREKRKDAQLLREVEIALPFELTDEQRERLVKEFVREFIRKGMVADVAIHEPGPDGDQRNHHCHILLTMREIGPEGFGDKVREWNSREQLEQWRDGWERLANRYLERHGHEARIDRRTLEEQGIDREPTMHRGPEVDAMERDGVCTERGAPWRATHDRNASLLELKVELSALKNEIRVAELETYLDTSDRDRETWDRALHDAAIEKEKYEREFVEPPRREPREDFAEAFNLIRSAYEMSDSAESFQAALAERGLWLARADIDDAAESQFNRGRLEREGRYCSTFEYGEYAAVDSLGRTFALDQAATGESRTDVAAFLRGLDRDAMPSIAATRAEALPSWPEPDSRQTIAHGYAYEAAERFLGGGASAVSNSVGKAFEAAVTAIEGLFDYGSKAAQARRQEPDLTRYLSDDSYRANFARQEIEDRQKREREYYDRQKERDR